VSDEHSLNKVSNDEGETDIAARDIRIFDHEDA
jgi:hypothetical protein